MRKTLRFAGIFLLLYALAAGLVVVALPRLTDWHFANCMHDPHPPFSCTISRYVLSDWWLVILPLLLIATAVIDRALSRRRAA